MTTINHNLDRLELEAGVDATRLLGAIGIAEERLLEARAAVTSEASLANCREYVEAYDKLQDVLRETVRRSAA